MYKDKNLDHKRQGGVEELRSCDNCKLSSLCNIRRLISRLALYLFIADILTEKQSDEYEGKLCKEIAEICPYYEEVRKR